MKKLHDSLLHLRPYDRFIEWSKTAVLPGFSNLPLYTVAVFFFQEIKREAILNKASSLAYNFMLAIFPGIIFLFTLIPYIPINNFQEGLMDFLAIVIPLEAFAAIESTLEDIIKNQNGGLMSFGFLLATFFSTNGVTNLMMAFNKSSLTREKRSWGHRRLIALGLSFAIIVALTIGIAVFTGAGMIITYLKDHITYEMSWFWTFVVKAARWIILFAIYFSTVSMLYKFGPSASKRWKLFSPGATLATILAILTFSGFVYYINNFNAYNKLYGSIGTIIVMMIWMYLNSLILLIGFELNASITLSKQSIKIVKPKVYNSFKQPSN
ncbi:MAG: YihY/virulence factor BrkB family protein [Sphingobacterium sp.]|jgi:membrane protein|uniref:YihY/virulence factor BrkB family protein n=1 Tax=Sphingobacterium tabacisoli TaxID=2044855 RepID=A0ABW5L475_9SPHI|nr:YihY/virulence factor BrkB family protein [Sphingobacterium tabacisoli]MDR2282442.1 YihY/virulence factor BrkB family protein [Sphingobacterium sp.]